MPLRNLVHAPRPWSALAVLALALAACTDRGLPTAPTPLGSIQSLAPATHDMIASAASPALVVSPASVTITQGRGMPFSAVNIDPLNAQQANLQITWSTSNAAIATVSSTGKVSGIAPGAVKITASALNGQLVAASAVTIAPKPVCAGAVPFPATFPGWGGSIPSGYEDTPLFFRFVTTDQSPCHKYTFTVTELPVSGTFYQVADDGTPQLNAKITLGMTVTNSEGWVAFVSNPNYNGTDSFRFVARDQMGRSSPYQNAIPIQVLPVNDPPVAIPAVHLGDNNYAITNVLVQATDVDNFSNQVDVCIATLTKDGDLYWGSVAAVNRVVAGDCRPLRSLRYVSRIDDPNVCSVKPPRSAYPLNDTFRWYATDRSATSDTATGTISIRYMNATPTYVGPASVATREDTPVVFTLNGSDPDGDFLALELYAPPRHGTLWRADGTQVLSYPALFLAPAQITYMPDANFNTLTQTDDLQFMVTDGYTNPCVSTVRFDVSPVNDAPTIQAPDNITADGSAAGVTFNGVIISDDARATDVLAVTLRAQGPAAAGVDLADPTGFSWQRISPTELRFQGTLTGINTLLGRGVRWTPNGPGPNYGELAITVDDNGNFGPGGPLVGTKIVHVDVAGEDGGLEGMRAAPPPSGAPRRRPPVPDRR